MPSLPLQAFLIGIGSWVAWSLVKAFLGPPTLAQIDGPRSESIFAGNMLKLFDKGAQQYQLDLMKKFGRLFAVYGSHKNRILWVYDPKALYHIFVKDHQSWDVSSEIKLFNALMFGKGLSAISGERHRIQRKVLNPVFSTTQMREMTPIFYGVVNRLRDTLLGEVGDGDSKEVEMLGWLTRTALEIVGQSGFGFSFDGLQRNSVQHPFGLSLNNLFRASQTPDIILARYIILPWVADIFSPRVNRFVIDALSIVWKNVRGLRDMAGVMEKTSVEIVQGAKAKIASGMNMSAEVGGGKDIMSLLIKANVSAAQEDKISDAELVALVSNMTFAATDTSSNAISRVLDLLSNHQDIQDKLRAEVIDAYEEHGGNLDYDALMALPLLDAVMRETLRLWPPVPTLARQTEGDTVLPLQAPITTVDGKEVSEIFVTAGTIAFASIIMCNRDPLLWGPDAEEWKPERWLSPLPKALSDAPIPGVYSHLMSFSGGFRSCIGFKFAQLEMKIVVSVLLKTFKFSRGAKAVIWQMNGITQPTTPDAAILPSGEKKLELPLVLTKLSQN